MEVIKAKTQFDICPATPEEAEIIDNKINNFNNFKLSFAGKMETAKNYSVKEGNTIIAGITCCFYLEEILYVNVLFVEENYRHKGIGSNLLKQVEAEAAAMGGRLAHLNTFDFQALNFYLKHGYEIFGVLEDCPKDHKRYYLKKSLLQK